MNPVSYRTARPESLVSTSVVTTLSSAMPVRGWRPVYHRVDKNSILFHGVR